MTAVTSATPASGTFLGKNLDQDGIVRLEIVDDFGQSPPQQSLRITATVLLEKKVFGLLVAAFASPAGNPRKVIQDENVTATPQFVNMAPEKPRNNSPDTRGTGGVPNDLVTTDFASSSTSPYQYTIHTEVYLKSLSDSDRKTLIGDIGSKNVKGIVDLLKSIGENVDPSKLTELLTAAFS